MRLSLVRPLSSLSAALAAVAVCVGARAAAAQRCASCAAPDSGAHTRLFPALGLHVGAPQKVSAALGVLVGHESHTGRRDRSQNVAVFVEPGLAAGRASAMYVANGFGSFGSGFGIGPSVLRTWDDPWQAKPNRTYVGGDLVLWPVVFIGPRIGLFHLTSGGSLEKRWLLTFDVGIGL